MKSLLGKINTIFIVDPSSGSDSPFSPPSPPSQGPNSPIIISADGDSIRRGCRTPGPLVEKKKSLEIKRTGKSLDLKRSSASKSLEYLAPNFE